MRAEHPFGARVACGWRPSRHVLAALRLRASPGNVQRAISKYQARGPNIDRASYKATVSIDILAPPRTLTASTSL
jgi:hypothetical protein